MLILRSLIGGAALAGLFEIYVYEVSNTKTAALTSKLIALAMVFLVSNLLHWLAFRNPSQRSPLLKLIFSFCLWLSFFTCSIVIGLTLHRGIVLGTGASVARLLSTFLACVGLIGIPFALLNCLVANWSEPTPLPLAGSDSVRTLLRKLTDSSAA
jgi:uncharacterized membrane protein